MMRGQKILLRPTVRQELTFRGAAGLNRFAWNWAVALLRRHYEMFGRGKKGYRIPTSYDLIGHWNKIKARRFPWVREYSKLIPETAFDSLWKAYKAAFAKLRRTGVWHPPKFHKKSHGQPSFPVGRRGVKSLSVSGLRIRIPKVGFVRFVGKLRWPTGDRFNSRVKFSAGRWWLSINYELPDPPQLATDRPTCGVDLGCKTFATVSSGGVITDEIAPPKPYAKTKRKLRRLQRRLRRRQKGSRGHGKAKLAVGKCHQRIARVRENFLHQLTSRLTKTYGTIVLEDLDIAALGRSWLSGTIRDLGMGKFRLQIEYKAKATGTKVVFANRWYPSSKTCSKCGVVKKELPLSERTFTCECGWSADRDHNAAMNLEQLPQDMRKVTPVETGVSSARKGRGAGRRSGNSTGRKAT